MTGLQLAERLVALLVAQPSGVEDEALDAACGAGAEQAAAVLRGRGYPLWRNEGRLQLAGAREHFDPAAFEAARRGRWGTPCEVWEVAESTNDLARAAAQAGASEGALWFAESQSAGRGRQGRTWQAAAHTGILASWILRRPTRRGDPSAGLLPLVLGLGICEGLRAATGLDLRTKWPNDLYLGGAKLGGILVESRPGATGWAVVGLGLNVERDPARDAALGVRTADLCGRRGDPRREVLLAAALTGAERRILAWRSGATERLLAEYRKLDLTQGRPVRVEQGATQQSGQAVGIADNGSLLVVGDDGVVRELVAGEVHLV